MQHLLYKALFELSSDRAEFIARLFSLKRPAGIERTAPIDQIWTGFESSLAVDRARFMANVADVEKLLIDTHGFALSPEDLKSLEYVYDAFFRFGPAIDYSGGVAGLTTGQTNFLKLTSAVDAAGVPRSFLASDEQFQFIRALQARNLVVPIQADFGGPKAIRAVGAFLRARGLTVSAFYISNVEQYLFNPRMPRAPGGQEINGGWRAFYDSLAALPADASTVLLRVPASAAVPRCSLVEFLAAVNAGKVTTQGKASACGRS